MPSIGYLCVSSFYSLLLPPYNCSPEKWHFRHSNDLSSHSFQPTGIKLGSLWRGNRCKLQRFIYKLFIFFFKLLILPKKYALFKKFPKIYYSIFFQKPVIGHTYICTKCIDNFKFTISLLGGEDFCTSAPKAYLFSITRFLYGWQKIFTN